MKEIMREGNVRVVDYYKYWAVEVWVLFDNSYNYDQSHQWVPKLQTLKLSEATQLFHTLKGEHNAN